MGLNHLMHPRNVYKDKPPDFKFLAQKYEAFRKFVIFAASGQVHLDFHNPDAVRCLTTTLLKEDFNLDVILPSEALVPRIPQRLNYLLLIEDLLIASGINDNVIGIDIGTGPSCIFPLLGADHCGWQFYATEIDEDSMNVAKLNVKNNRLEQKIAIIRGHDSSFFREILGSHSGKIFSFSMCNPPFFDREECEARFQMTGEGEFVNCVGKTEGIRRPGPLSATSAKSSELWVRGGEVSFVTQMIRESQIFGHRIKLFTSLIGKKKSLAPLKRILDDIKFVSFCSHPISQGKTQRWVLVWTFDPTIKIHDNFVTKSLVFPSSEDNPVAFFCHFCEFTGVSVKKHISGILMCFIPSSVLGFKPWKYKTDSTPATSDEPPIKKVKSFTFDKSCQTEFNKDNDCGNLCPSGDFNSVETSSSSNEIQIQCCLEPIKSSNSRNFRLIVSRNQNSLLVEFLSSNDVGFRWLESAFNFYRDKYRI